MSRKGNLIVPTRYDSANGRYGGTVSGILTDRGLPDGFLVRAPNMGDLSVVFDLLTACDIAHLGTPDTVLEDVREEWEDRDLEHDASVVLSPEGRLVGLATVDGQARMQADVYVPPEYAGLGIEEYLRQLTETRARERAGTVPEGEPVRLETWISTSQEADS